MQNTFLTHFKIHKISSGRDQWHWLSCHIWVKTGWSFSLRVFGHSVYLLPGGVCKGCNPVSLIGPQTNLTQLLQMIVFCEGISVYMISPLFSCFFVFPLSFYTCIFSFITYIYVSCFCCFWFMFLVWPCLRVSHSRMKIYTNV